MKFIIVINMVLKRIVRSIIKMFYGLEEWSIKADERVYEAKEELESTIDEIHSVWDYLEFKQNTQAFHLSAVLGFDEWVDMEEIRRRVKDLFGVEYKNERSLYPYLKTLTDVGLMENNSVGGRMQWRKHDLLLKVKKEAGKKKVVVAEAKQAKKELNKGKENE